MLAGRVEWHGNVVMICKSIGSAPMNDWNTNRGVHWALQRSRGDSHSAKWMMATRGLPGDGIMAVTVRESGCNQRSLGRRCVGKDASRQISCSSR